MDFTNLKGINQSNSDQADKVVDKATQELATLRTQEVFVKSIQALANIIQNHDTRTVVLNQLRDYATSDDISGVESGIKSLLEELKTHENTDVTPIVDVLKEAVTELKSIPKDKLEIEIPEQVDYTERFNDLVEETKNVLKAIQEQETTVEAPVVNVEAPTVNVDAPDLKPLTKEVNTAFAKAIKSIVFPEYKVDLSTVEKEQKKQTQLLKDIRDTPSGGSSGGGGSIAPFLDDTNALPTSSPSLAVRLDDTTTADTIYIGKAPIGSATNAAVWQISRLATSSGLIKTWSDGDASYNNIWDNRASLSYS